MVLVATYGIKTISILRYLQTCFVDRDVKPVTRNDLFFMLITLKFIAGILSRNVLMTIFVGLLAFFLYQIIL